MMLQAEHVGRDYPTPQGPLTVLDDVNLVLAAGSTLAIVGPSGSGKSTLLGLLAGLDRPTRGHVLIDGQNLADMNDTEASAFRGQRMGFVFQSHRLLPVLTAEENVAAPLRIAGVPDGGRARAALQRVGLGHRLDHRPQQLSGGEQQRVAVARAMVHEPALLFADEPTGNLDHKTGAGIADLLFALAAERQTTLILVTHDETLASRCAHIVRMADGRIVT